MKKIILLLAILSICVTQVACGNKSTQKPTTNTPNLVEKPTMQSAENKPPENENIIHNDIYSLIPEGWKVFEKVKGEPVIVEGDLNKDGISDIVAVIVGASETEMSSPRSLLIAFGNKDNTYTLSIIAEKAILRADQGGVWGDPLESISISNGSILLTFYGGSNWRWYHTYRFRYQEDGWYLIGATLGSYFSGNVTRENADEEDYNLLTGDYIFKKTNDAGIQNTTKGNRGKRALVNLKDFVVDSEDIQF